MLASSPLTLSQDQNSSDITMTRALERTVEEQKGKSTRMMNLLSQMLAVSRLQLTSFIRDGARHIERIRAAMTDPIANYDRLFRELHTIKGSCRAMKFGQMANEVHEAESTLSELKQHDATSATFTALHKQLTDQIGVLIQEVEYYAHVYHEVFGKASFEDSGWSLHSFAGYMFPMVRATLGKAGFEVQRFEIRDRVPEWDRDMRETVQMILAHCVNNAIDHGYVLPSERGEEVGAVDFEIKAEPIDANWIKLSIADRGVGLNMKKIRELAMSFGRADLANSRPEEILFETGASTAGKLTISSGRGVGLGAIRGAAREMGGDAHIRANAGGGTLVEVVLPKKYAPAAGLKAVS